MFPIDHQQNTNGHQNLRANFLKPGMNNESFGYSERQSRDLRIESADQSLNFYPVMGHMSKTDAK
jgi:hypothetical protein